MQICHADGSPKTNHLKTSSKLLLPFSARPILAGVAFSAQPNSRPAQGSLTRHPAPAPTFRLSQIEPRADIRSSPAMRAISSSLLRPARIDHEHHGRQRKNGFPSKPIASRSISMDSRQPEPRAR
jgi:hypothetical protein